MTIATTHRIQVSDDYIVEAQRLAIAQSTALRLIYQTWWVVWPARLVLLGALAISFFVEALHSLAIPCGVLLALSFGNEIFKRRSLARARARVRTKGSTTTVRMNEEGIDLSHAFGSSHLEWAAMLQPAIQPHGVLIKFSRLSTIWLPDSALIEGTPWDVRQLLASKVPVTAIP